jgi:Family of unknown function (DUF6134)
MKAHRFLAAFVLAGLSAAAWAGAGTENRFGSIHIDGKKAGQIHYTIEYGEAGDVETLRTRASLSILGVRLFNFEQTLHEEWRRGELHQLRSRTDDGGKIFEASLSRGAEVYRGRLNGAALELPDKAFPASVWHYRIVDRTLLFDLKDFKLLNVKIARAGETLALPDGRKVSTERFDFSGDWRATAWFDQKRELVKFKYVVDGHEVEVRLDDRAN